MEGAGGAVAGEEVGELWGDDAGGEEVGDEAADERGHADAGLVMAGADEHLRMTGDGAHDGAVLGGIGTQASPGADDRGTCERGEDGDGILAKRFDGGRDGRFVEAGFGFGGGADEDVVLPGDEVSGAALDDVGDERLRRGEHEGLALGGARGGEALEEGIELGGPGAGGDEEAVGGEVARSAGACCVNGEGEIGEGEAIDGGLFKNGDAAAKTGGFEGGDEGGDVDLRGEAAMEGVEVGGIDEGLKRADLIGRENFKNGTRECGSEGDAGMAEGGFLSGTGEGVRVEQEFEASAAAEGDGECGIGGQFGKEGLHLGKALAVELLEGAVGERAGRPECAEGGVRGPPTAIALFEKGDLAAGLSEPPGTGEAHDAAADDEDTHGNTGHEVFLLKGERRRGRAGMRIKLTLFDWDTKIHGVGVRCMVPFKRMD